MSLTKRRIVFLVFSFTIIGILTFAAIKNNFYSFYNQAAAPLTSPIPSLIPTPFLQNDEVISPDGTMKLTLQTKNKADGNISYSIFTETTEGQDRQEVFNIDNKNGEISLSSNSWSPDNKYFFIIQKKYDLINAFVFKSDQVSRLNPDIDLLSIFEKNGSDFEITNVTGWDSETLLHVRTQEKKNKKKGPSYWFDIISQGYIEL